MTGHVEMRRGSPLVAYELLVAEAERVRSRDPRRAAGMFLEASVSHMMTGDMHALVATAERARALATSADPAVELLATAVIGEAYLALGDVEQGDALLSACEPYLLEGDPLAIVEVVGMAAHSSVWIEKFDRAQRIFDRLIAAARDASAVSALIYPLAARSHLDFRLGRWAAARAEATESVELAQDTGQLPLLAHSLAALAHVEAAMGAEDACRRHVDGGPGARRALPGRGDRHLPARRARAARARARPHPRGDRRARGDPARTPTACRCSRRVVQCDAGPDRGLRARRPPRRGARADRDVRRPRRARPARAGRRRRPPACARCSRPTPSSAPAFEAALALHEGLPMPFERARTLLCLGERLRRARQRADAREPLKEALETFERLGARGWAERTRTELRATGEQQARRAETAAEQLTPHELQIAVLVAQGMTNREAAAALFLSPKTIEYHLGQIYRKLDVRGRAQLARLMAMELPEGERDPAVLAEAWPKRGLSPRGRKGGPALLVQLLFEARGVVARLLGRLAGGVEVGLGLVGLLAGVLGGGERVLEALGGALGRLLRAVELALAGAAFGARLAQLGLELAGGRSRSAAPRRPRAPRARGLASPRARRLASRLARLCATRPRRDRGRVAALHQAPGAAAGGVLDERGPGRARRGRRRRWRRRAASCAGGRASGRSASGRPA